MNPDELPYYDPAVDRRVALVTGGNSGIGWFTVLHLYLHGFTVYIAGRSCSRVSKCIKEIKLEAERRRSHVIEHDLCSRFLGDLKFVQMDLLDLRSVEKAAAKFSALEKKLHLLILNAGVMALPFATTRDGFEIQFQTNYVAHFLLTQRLVHLLDRTSHTTSHTTGHTTSHTTSHTAPGRVVFVSSVGHFIELFKFSNDWQFNYWPNFVFTWLRYAQAKTCGIQFMKMLAVKYPNVKSYSVHPGFVMNTNLFSYWTKLPIFGICFWFFFQIFGYFFGCSNEEGAYSTLKCALSTSPSVLVDNNGGYFTTKGVLATPSAVSSDINNCAENWVWTINQLRKRGYNDLD